MGLSLHSFVSTTPLNSCKPQNDAGQSPGSSLSPIPCECDCTSVSSPVHSGTSQLGPPPPPQRTGGGGRGQACAWQILRNSSFL